MEPRALHPIPGGGDRRGPRAPHGRDGLCRESQAARKLRRKDRRHDVNAGAGCATRSALPEVQPAGPGQGGRLPLVLALRLVRVQLTAAVPRQQELATASDPPPVETTPAMT